MNDLAFVYAGLGRFDEAIQMQERVMALDAKTVGADHPEALWREKSLGGFYERSGNLAKAEEIYRGVVTRARGRFTAGEWDLGQMVLALGTLPGQGRQERGGASAHRRERDPVRQGARAGRRAQQGRAGGAGGSASGRAGRQTLRVPLSSGLSIAGIRNLLLYLAYDAICRPASSGQRRPRKLLRRKSRRHKLPPKSRSPTPTTLPPSTCPWC